METSATFEPPPGGVGVSFVRGAGLAAKPPAVVKRAGLTVRFAVVQQTYVEGCADMYFDAPLWRALAQFVRSYAGEGGAQVTTDGRTGLPLDRFLEDWEMIAADEREPPPVLTAFSDGRAVLCMVTEYWAHVGGPALYHDSYTYALYAAQDVGEDVLAALARAPARARWAVAPLIHVVAWAPPPSLAQRLKSWITGAALND